MPDLARRNALLAMLVAAGVAGAGCSASGLAPRFDYTLLDGVRRDSALLRGQVVLVNFWATSCAICVREMPQLIATHLRFSGRGLQTLAVAVQQDAPALVASFAQSRQLPFAVAIDNTGAIARAFGDVEVTPTRVLIDRRGAIVSRSVGAPDLSALHAQLDRLLAPA